MSPALRRLTVRSCVVALVLLLLPGWRAELVEAPHDVALADAPQIRTFGTTSRIDGDAGEWHLRYEADLLRRGLSAVGLVGLTPPLTVARVPEGARFAAAYFRVEPRVHWPWWRSGRGLPLEAAQPAE